MDYHKNARLTVSLLAELAKRVVFEGVTLKLAAASFNVTPSKTTLLANSASRETVSLAFL